MTTLITSCKKDQQTTLDIGHNYYSDKIGKYIVYNVDSIVMNSFTKKVDTFYFQVKEVIESVFYDNAGRPTMRVERYRKDSSKTTKYSQLPWILTDAWSANRTKNSIEKVEENVRFTKLIFPVELYRIWNGNAYNSLGEWNYKYTEINKAKTIGGRAFDSTLTVIQIDEDKSLIDKKYYKEIYAKNVGLIYKEIIDVHSDVFNAQPIMNRVTSGIIKYTATINQFGG